VIELLSFLRFLFVVGRPRYSRVIFLSPGFQSLLQENLYTTALFAGHNNLRM